MLQTIVQLSSDPGLMMCLNLRILHFYTHFKLACIFTTVTIIAVVTVSIYIQMLEMFGSFPGHFTGDSEIKAMVARAQQPWRGRQHSSERPGADEERRAAHGRSGELSDTNCSSAQGRIQQISQVTLYFLLSNLTARHSWSSDSGHDLHTCRRQSLAALQRVLQNVSDVIHRETRNLKRCLYCKHVCHVLDDGVRYSVLLLFLSSTVNSLGVLTGQLLLGMTKEEIRTVCPEEGGKVFFQLQAIKSTIAVSSVPFAIQIKFDWLIWCSHTSVMFHPVPYSSPVNCQAPTMAATKNRHCCSSPSVSFLPGFSSTDQHLDFFGLIHYVKLSCVDDFCQTRGSPLSELLYVVKLITSSKNWVSQKLILTVI